MPTDYQNQDNPWVHFGLGQDESVDSVVIRWPLGLREVFAYVQINQYHYIKEGQSLVNVENHHQKSQVLSSWHLQQNYPNPFNSSTSINYSLSKNSIVVMQIFDVSCRMVQTLIQKYQQAGTYSTSWNGKNKEGQTVASGIYLCHLRAEEYSGTIKMIYAQ